MEEEIKGLAFPQGKVVSPLSHVPEASNTVVIVAENSPGDRDLLLRELELAGRSGLLADKFVVLQYCGEGRTDVAGEILGWGASGVFFYESKIFVPAVRLVLREVDALLRADPGLKADEAFRQAILRALEKARESDLYKSLETQLRKMLDHFTIALAEGRKVG